MGNNQLTYDVVFNDDWNSNCKGWHESMEYCIEYIQHYNGSGTSYFEDYKSGVVEVICNETSELVYKEFIK